MWKVVPFCVLLLCVGGALIPSDAKTLNPTQKGESLPAFSLVEAEACMSWQGNPVKDTIPKNHTQVAIHHVTPQKTLAPLSVSVSDERPPARNETKCCGGLSCKFLDGVCCPGSSHCCPRGYLCNTDTDPPSCEDDMQDVNKHRIMKRRVSRIKITNNAGDVVSDTAEPHQTNDPTVNNANKESSELEPAGIKNNANITAAEKAEEQAEEKAVEAEQKIRAEEEKYRIATQKKSTGSDYGEKVLKGIVSVGAAWPPMVGTEGDGLFVESEQRDWSGHGLIRNGSLNILAEEANCQAQCEDIEECRIAVYHRSNGECWLDSALSTKPQPCVKIKGQRDCVSFVKKMSALDINYEYGQTSNKENDWFAYDQQNWNVATADVKDQGGRLLRNGKHNRVNDELECRMQCAGLAYCRVAMYIKNTGECWLSSKLAGKGSRCALRGRERKCVSFIKKKTKNRDGIEGASGYTGQTVDVGSKVAMSYEKAAEVAAAQSRK